MKDKKGEEKEKKAKKEGRTEERDGGQTESKLPEQLNYYLFFI